MRKFVFHFLEPSPLLKLYALHFLRGDKHESLSEDLYFLCFDIHVALLPLLGWPPASSCLSCCVLQQFSPSALQLLLFFHQLVPTAELVDSPSKHSHLLPRAYKAGGMGVRQDELRQGYWGAGLPGMLEAQSAWYQKWIKLLPLPPQYFCLASHTGHFMHNFPFLPSHLFSFLQYILSTYVPGVIQNLSQIKMLLQ